MIRKIAYVVLYLLIPAGILAILSFTGERNRYSPCRELQIRVEGHHGNHFLRPEQVRMLINEKMDTLEGRILDPATMQALHRLVHDIPYVERASIYRTISGELRINISQRDPLIRVINNQNQSYYIDRQGTIFPLAEEHTARVMLATGSIDQGFTPGYHVLSDEADANSEREGVVADLFKMAHFIDNDTFWKAFIDHIYVTPSGKFELTPKNGVHIIEFGHANDMEEKFRKLKIFYLNGLPQVGWSLYRRVNIEFKNQIVCSK